MKKRYYPAVFHPEESGFSVYIADIDGCFTQGDTMEEACRNAEDAIGLCLEQYEADGKAYPEPAAPPALEPGDFTVLIAFDELDYRRRNDSRAVKKTLTIPSWLNYLAEKENVNFSQELQNALKAKLHISD